MKELRIHVERAVRPIRASNLRKDRMREELLAHLRALYEEELARTHDEVAAQHAAIGRFGDADKLSAEMQDSVPRIERWAFYRIPFSGPIRRRAGETLVHYVLRAAYWGWAIGLTLYSLLAVGVTLASRYRPHRPDQPTTTQLILFFIGCATLQFAAMAASGLICEAIRREMNRRSSADTTSVRRRSTWNILGLTLTGSATFGAAFAGLMLLVEICVPIPIITRARFWWVIAAAATFGLPATWLQAWGWRATARRIEDWESLELDEPSAA